MYLHVQFSVSFITVSFTSYVNGQYIQSMCSAINTALQIAQNDFSHFGGHLQFQIQTGAVKRPPCSNFALLNDHFQFLWSFKVNLNSQLRNIFIIILYFVDLPVEMLKF